MEASVNPLRTSAILSLHSLQDRTARASLLRELGTMASLPAPIAEEQIRDVVNFENALYRLIRFDKRWFFAHAGQIEAVEFARDIQVLHSAAAKALNSLVVRRGEWSRNDDDPLLQRLIGFALYHFGAAGKWCFLRHETLRSTAWPPLHALYRLAEQAGIATYPMRLFDDEGGHRTTLQALYLRALVLDVLNTGSLSMAQVEIADGWLADWATGYTLDTDYSPDTHTLFVDLDAAAGMQIATGNADGPSWRYLRIDRLKDQVEAVRAELRAGRSFHGRGVPNTFPVEEQVGLLNTIERLYQTLLQASASRIEERTQVANLIAEVRLGFEAVRRAIAGEHTLPPETDTVAVAMAPPMKFGGIELTLAPTSSPNRAEDAFGTVGNDRPGESRWEIRDMSSRGVGLVVSRKRGEQISIGESIAVKPEGFAHWMMGVIVRKITSRTADEVLLGVEILSLRPLPVLLARFAHSADAEPDPALTPIAAIYLPGRDTDGAGDILVLPAGDFGLKTVFSLATRAARFRVRINRVLRKGSDWIGLHFEAIGRKEWPAADSRSHR